MFWGRQPGHPPHGASRGTEPTHSSVRCSGGTAHAIAQPVAPSTPCSHPPAVCLPAPRGLASLAEGGAAAGGSRCHLHLAALGTGGGSSTALPRALGIPRGMVAEGWEAAGSPGGCSLGKAPAATPPGRDQLPAHAAQRRAWLYLAPRRWWRSRSWKWPSASSAGRNTVWAPGSAGQRDRGVEGRAEAMLGHGAPWG